LGNLTIKVNVRSGPGVEYESLGLLDAGQPVQVTLQSDNKKWYRIVYADASDGVGWVTAQFVTFPTGTPFFFTATSSPTSDLPTGRVIQRLNVRTGPGTSFESLGTLDVDTVVILTGKNSVASWFQIEYPIGSVDRAWVTAQYVQTSSSFRLPVLDEYGQPISTGTPGQISLPMTPTPTIGPALLDGDSSNKPVLRMTFKPGGINRYIFSSQVSTPAGDTEDWLEFIPFTSLPGADARLYFDLKCTGNGTLMVELWLDGGLFPSWEPLECNSLKQSRSLPAGSTYQLKLSVLPGSGLQLVNYTLSVDNLP
jgi:uncharacterized protein YraI